MKPALRRTVVALVLAAACGTIGAFVGVWWYETFGPPWGQFGSEFEGVAEAFRGVLTGTMAGALLGALLFGPRRLSWKTKGAVAIGCVAAAILFAVGISYIGDLTNYEAPTNPVPYLGILGIPAAVALVIALMRLTRRA
jgi:ABC-type transport system involved in cytochrome c biogenesis permease subunit